MHIGPTPEEDRVTKHIPFVARMRGDRLRVQLQVEHLYDLHEAAAALAVVKPEASWRLGRRTLHVTLQEAARQNLSGRAAKQKADPEMAEFYRQKLIEFGIFPAPDEDEEGTLSDDEQ